MKPIGRVKQIVAACMLCLLTAVAYTPGVQAGAQQSSSAHYGVSEVNFGSGSQVNACSTNYCSDQTAGDLTVGNTKSASYQAQAGSDTARQELLEISQSSTSINLGTLSSAATGTGTSTFSIRNYLSSGYIVTVSGTPPTNASGNHQITTMASADITRPGTEQFGINLVSNTSPAVGANVQEVPDSTFSFGVAASGYNTANNFKFVSGDTIAQSPSSSGTSTYTLSAIENVSTNTPAGIYKTRLMLSVIPTF